MGAEYDLDCLIVFTNNGEDIPVFLRRCAYSSKNAAGTCEVQCIFATKEGTCSACSKHRKRVSTTLVVVVVYLASRNFDKYISC